MKRLLLISLFACAPVLSSAAAPPTAPATGAVPAPGSPMATLKAKNGEVDKLLRQKADPGSPAETKQKADIKVLAGTLLDYGELTKRAMAEHWDQINAGQFPPRPHDPMICSYCAYSPVCRKDYVE